jgi:hypothetical protein
VATATRWSTSRPSTSWPATSRRCSSAQETLREYYPYFNFERAVLLSKEDGVDGFGREYDTALGGYTTGTFAGHVGIDHELVDKVLPQDPDTTGRRSSSSRPACWARAAAAWRRSAAARCAP